jgi:hypothetical protein
MFGHQDRPPDNSVSVSMGQVLDGKNQLRSFDSKSHSFGSSHSVNLVNLVNSLLPIQLTNVPKNASTIVKLSAKPVVSRSNIDSCMRSVSFDSVDLNIWSTTLNKYFRGNNGEPLFGRCTSGKERKSCSKRFLYPSGATPGGGLNSEEYAWKLEME